VKASALHEVVKLSASSPRQFEVAVERGKSLTIRVRSKGAEVVAEIRAIKGTKAATAQATYGGWLQWTLGTSELERTLEGSDRAVVAISTDAVLPVEVDLHLTIGGH
jgi:hypothetical protein